jgi:hypothetical protein
MDSYSFLGTPVYARFLAKNALKYAQIYYNMQRSDSNRR